MATTRATPFLWGKPRFGAVKVISNEPEFVDLIINGKTTRLRRNDPGLKELSPYRVKGKNVLVPLYRTPEGKDQIFAVYVTDSERLVQQICKIMVDPCIGFVERKQLLLKKHPRYLVL